MAEIHYVNWTDHRTRVRVNLTHIRGRITSFLVKLEYLSREYWQDDWTEIARFDHNPDGGGHDVIEEGLHVDVTLHDGTEVTYWYDDYYQSYDLDEIISNCVRLFESQPSQFIEVYEGTIDSDRFDPPSPV